MIANLNQSKRLICYIVLAALTCASASPSTVEQNTIFADYSAPKHSLGVVDQSDARSKRYLKINSDTTKSMDGENEDRVLIPESSVASEGVPAKVEELVEAGVIPGIVATDHTPAAMVGTSAEVGVIPGTAAIDHALAAELRIIQDTTDQLFKKDMGGQIGNHQDLFRSNDYTKWSKSADEMYKKFPEAAVRAKVAKVSTLLAIYKKDVVISMLATGRKNPTTQKIADDLELGLLTKWIIDDDGSNIINLLTFGKDKSEVLLGTSLEFWFTSLTNINRNPYELFVKHFTEFYSDKKLVELLVVAEADDRTRTLATELAKHQLEHWKNSDVSVTRSFELLELNEEHLDTLLRNPMLSTWIDYVKMLGPDPYEVLLLAMRERVGDKKLDSILAAAKADGTNESIWRVLLHMQEKHQSLERLKGEYPQVEEWWAALKSGEHVFDLLKLSEKSGEMIGTEDWNAWVAYMTFLENQKPPKDQREIATVIFSVLKNRFSGEDLAKLVATAKTVERTKDIAAEWERIEWRIAQRTPDEVFDLLKLKEKGYAVFESLEFKSWASYVKELNSLRSREDDVELAYQLYRHYGPNVKRMLWQAGETAIARNDEVTKTFVNNMRNEFKILNSLEKKELGKRLRTSPPALANDSSKRTKMLDGSKPPTRI